MTKIGLKSVEGLKYFDEKYSFDDRVWVKILFVSNLIQFQHTISLTIEITVYV